MLSHVGRRRIRGRPRCSSAWSLPHRRPVLLRVRCRAAGGNRKGYAGYEFDPVLTYSIWHVRKRAFNSDLGRWLRRDSLLAADGVGLYGYVNNQPLSHNDPTGLLGIAIKPCAGTSDTIGGCGGFQCSRYYQLDGASPCSYAGVRFVQHLVVEGSCAPCGTCFPLPPTASIETWETFTGAWTSDPNSPIDWSRTACDTFQVPGTEGYCGHIRITGELRAYCYSDLVLLHEVDPFLDWQIGEVGTLESCPHLPPFGTGEARHKPDPGPPAFWNELKPIAGGHRTFSITFRCCCNSHATIGRCTP